MHGLGLNASAAVRAGLPETDLGLRMFPFFGEYMLECMLDAAMEAELRTARGHEYFTCSMCETVSTLEEEGSIFHFPCRWVLFFLLFFKIYLPKHAKQTMETLLIRDECISNRLHGKNHRVCRYLSGLRCLIKRDTQ